MRRPRKQQPRIVLASTSPRRIELLQQARIIVEVIGPDTDEIRKPREAPRALVSRLAREKAASVARKLQEPALVIAADTIVVAPDGKTVLGKPRSVAEARKMLRMLAGKAHTVLTGYCVLEGGKLRPSRVVRVVVSRVKMRSLSKTDIERYVATGEPMDKAGSYAAQGLGMALIEELRGSYTNVVGLPMCQLLSDLEEKFGIPLFPNEPNR